MTVVKMNIMTITKTILDVQPASPNLIMILNYLTEGTNREKVVNGHRYLYDAKVSGNRVQSQDCLCFSEEWPTIIYDNSEFFGGVTNTAKFSLYVSPYLVASQGGRYTKHIYIGSQRIVSKLGDLASYGADPRRIPYAGTEADGISVDYQTKYNRQQQAIRDNYADFGVPYNGEDNNDYVNVQGFSCNDVAETSAARAKAARAIDGNLTLLNLGGTRQSSSKLALPSLAQGFKPNDDYEKLQFYYHPDHLGSSGYITNLDGEVVQHIEYVPFGEIFIEERNNTWNTPYLFNAKEYDEETGMYYYGARYYDPRISLWMSVDPLAEKNHDLSPYNYTANNPIRYIDPDGKYILFINGLRLWHASMDQKSFYGGFKIHPTDVYHYWSTDKNSFGRKVDLVAFYKKAYKDDNVGFTSGSSYWNSSAQDRVKEGYKKAELFHKTVMERKIKLSKNETIKVISHSQGGAHAAGFTEKLMSYKDKEGNPLYHIEIMEYITPHQPMDFSHPKGPCGIQYSHPNDAVASDSPWWMPNGGTAYGKINNINYFYGGDIIGGEGQIKNTGATGNMGGHKVTDNDEFIR